MKTQSVQVSKEVKATPEKIWSAWSDISTWKEWFMPGPGTAEAEGEVVMGGSYSVKFSGGPQVMTTRGTFTLVQPPKKLVFTWHYDGTPADASEQLVTVELQPKGDGTLVTLTHSGFTDTDSANNHKIGWEAILGAMDKAVA